MTPIEYYKKQLDSDNITADFEQEKAIMALNDIYNSLIKERKKRQGLIANLRKPKTQKGLYLWGSVGIGKTFMMDCFYHCLPFENKMRMHFHSFMQLIHRELKKSQGQKNPLRGIAKNIASKTMVICFDEFFVSDIADAMILARLFDALFKEGVTLIATSNTEPTKLYERGLQRQQFLPAIDLIQKHTIIMHIPTIIDYRLRHLKNVGVYYTPDDDIAQRKMDESFDVLTREAAVDSEAIELFDRLIPVVKKANDVVWFDFNVICHTPRSQDDYLAIADNYHTVFVSHLPHIAEDDHNSIILFIKMIDVFYDQGIRLILSAKTDIDGIYPNGRMKKDFERTRSRLLEMQSETYFNRGS